MNWLSIVLINKSYLSNKDNCLSNKKGFTMCLPATTHIEQGNTKVLHKCSLCSNRQQNNILCLFVKASAVLVGGCTMSMCLFLEPGSPQQTGRGSCRCDCVECVNPNGMTFTDSDPNVAPWRPSESCAVACSSIDALHGECAGHD